MKCFGISLILIFISFQVYAEDQSKITTEFSTPRINTTVIPWEMWVILKPTATDNDKKRIISKFGPLISYPNVMKSELCIKVKSSLTVEGVIKLAKEDPAISRADSSNNCCVGPDGTAQKIPEEIATPGAKKDLFTGGTFVPGVVLVKLKPNLLVENQISVFSGLGVACRLKFVKDMFLLHITNGMSVQEVIKKLKNEPSVKNAEPNYVGKGQ